MPGIVFKPGEPLDKVLRIFKKHVEKSGVIGDLKKKCVLNVTRLFRLEKYNNVKNVR